MKRMVLAWGLAVWLIGGAELVSAAPIHDAAEAGDTSKLQELLSAGAKPNETRSGDEATALHLAVLAGNLAAVQLLLDAGADVNVHTRAGYTPLHLAALNGLAEITQLVLSHGAEVDAVAADGSTPLHLAALSGNEAVIRRLLDAGADRSIRNFEGRTPYEVAIYRGHDDAAKLIVPTETVTPSIYRDSTADIERRIEQMDAAIARYRTSAANQGAADNASRSITGQDATPSSGDLDTATPSTAELLKAAGDLISQSREPTSFAPEGIDAAIAKDRAKGEPAGLDDSQSPNSSSDLLPGDTPSGDATIADARAFLQSQAPEVASASSAPRAGAGGYAVQLVSVRSRDRAEQEWARLKAAHADLLVALEHEVTTADLGERGTFYRLRAGPLTRDRASSICDSLADGHESCIVVKR
jgi:ankyrin repeat protein